MRGGSRRPIIIGVIGLVIVGVALALNYLLIAPELARKSAPPARAPEAATEAPLEAPAVTPPSAEATAKAEAPAPEAAKPQAEGGPAATMPIPPSFDVVRIGPRGEAVVAGRAAPHAEVTILNRGKEIGHATADDNGEWVWLPDKPFEPGNLELSLKAQLPGQTPVEAESKVVLIIPEREKDIAGRSAPATS